MKRRAWRLFPLQSPEIKAISQHMTPSEKRASLLRSMLIGGVLGVSMVISQMVIFVARIYGHPFLVGTMLLGGGLLAVVLIGRIRQRTGELLCSTAWAMSQGYRPEDLPELRPLSGSVTILLGLTSVFTIGGFFVLSGTAYRAFGPTPTTPTQMVASWRWYGIWLPDATEVGFLRKNLPSSLRALGVGLTDPNTTVRRCTAQALEELGPAARLLVPNLRGALAKETDPLVRVYFAKAFGPIGDASPTTMSFLRTTLAKETDEDAKNYLRDSIAALATRNKRR